MKIQHLCSLGTNCHSSSFLKRNNYKLESYPFDWIISKPENFIHCIEDDFNIFLDKNYYININHYKCGHTFYAENMFPHHNPLLNINDYNYYTRCVSRFRNFLKSKDAKMLILTFINGEYGIGNKITEEFKNKILGFNDRLKKHIENKYILLVLINYPCKKENNYTLEKYNEVHFLEIDTISNSNGVCFDNENDNIYLDNLIKENYNIKPKPL